MKLFRSSLLCIAGTVLFASCLKKDFDSPPDNSKYDPQIPVNATLGKFSSDAFSLASGKTRVLGDSTIYGIVVGDDRSGNIYKKLFIQDSTGGMQIIIDKTNLYGDYPVGRKVYVKLKGLILMNYKGTPEIVYSQNSDGTTNGIPSSLVGNYIIKGNYPNAITPKEVTMTDLFSNPFTYANTIVKINDMQFDATSSNVLYSDPNASTNRRITDCAQTSGITMYNSNYSTFQPAKTPTGNGSIVGLVTVYISTPQLTLRDTSDVRFNGSRCQ